jgi:hypothetical protein
MGQGPRARQSGEAASGRGVSASASGAGVVDLSVLGENSDHPKAQRRGIYQFSQMAIPFEGFGMSQIWPTHLRHPACPPAGFASIGNFR